MPNPIIAEFQSEGLNQIVGDLRSANVETDKFNQNVDESNDLLSQLANGLRTAKDRLAGMKEGTKEFNALKKEIDATESIVQGMAKSSVSLRTELKNTLDTAGALGRQMKTLEKEGLAGTQAYKVLKQQFEATKEQVGALKDEIGDLNDETSQLGSDTKGLDLTIRSLTQIGAAFQIAEGASALFGAENKELEEALIRLNGIMAITNGLQQVQEELLRKDSISARLAARAHSIYNLVIGRSTGLMKLFKIALASTGIGLLIVALGVLVANFGRIRDALIRTFPQLEKVGEFFTDLKGKSIDFVKNGVLALSNGFIDVYNKSLILRVGLAAIGETFRFVANGIVERLKLIASPFSGLFKAINTIANGGGISEALGVLRNEVLGAASDFKEAGEESVRKFNEGIQNAKNNELQKLTIDDIFPPSEQKKAEKVGGDLVRSLTGLDALKAEFAAAEKALNDLIVAEQKAGNDPALNQKIQELKLQLQGLNKEIQAAEQGYIDLFKEVQEIVTIEKKGPVIIDTNKSKGELKTLENQAGETSKSLGSKLKEIGSKLFGTSRDQFESDFEYKVGLANKYFEFIQNGERALSDIVLGISEIRTQREVEILEEKRKAGLISEQQFIREQNKLKNQQAQKDKRASVAQAALNIPIAISGAFAGTSGGLFVRIAAAAAAGVLASVNLAKVVRAKVPQYFKGVIGLQNNDYPNGVDTVPAMLTKGESVMTVAETNKYRPVLEAMRKGTFDMQPLNLGYFADRERLKVVDTRPQLLQISEGINFLTTYVKQGNSDRNRGNKNLLKQFAKGSRT